MGAGMLLLIGMVVTLVGLLFSIRDVDQVLTFPLFHLVWGLSQTPSGVSSAGNRTRTESPPSIGKLNNFRDIRPTLLLTGSSSIRLWPDAAEAFPQFDLINAGFGGSCYSDLWALRDTLLFAFEPDVVVIYEGDNDLSDGLPQSEILSRQHKLCLRTLPNGCPTRTSLCWRPQSEPRPTAFGRGVQIVV